MNMNLAEDNIALNDEINVKNDIKVETTTNIIYRFLKRLMDIVGGIIGILILIPLTIIVAIARIVTKEYEGTIIFKQLRIGKNGKQFKLYKYRSMVVEADEKLERYLEKNEEAKKEYQKYKKLRNDPRITRVGKFMRKLSLDEFPQFINVLKGDMSLVGPRPYLPRERKDIDNYKYEIIIKVKPGITGYWQINGRNDIDFQERIQMDIDYIRTRTLLFDIKILLRTVLKIFDKEGK